MAEALERAGHTLVRDPREAEVYVLNSCTVTHRADADARRALRKAQREHPSLRVVLTGCHVDADPRAAAALPGLDAVLGNTRKAELVELLEGLGPRGAAPLVSASALTRRLPFTPLEPALVPRRSRVMTAASASSRCTTDCQWLTLRFASEARAPSGNPSR